MIRIAVLASIALVAAGCQKQSSTAQGDAERVAVVPAPPAPDASESANPDDPPVPSAEKPKQPAFAGTAGLTQKKRAQKQTAVQRDVRAARHEGYDRVVFEFEDGVLPGHHIEYVDRPIYRCGSGQVVPVQGDGWLSVRLEIAAAHDDRGKATIAEAERQRRYELGVLGELVLTCDFEGQVIWVLGVRSPNRYRVLELDSPARLVVDIRHD